MKKHFIILILLLLVSTAYGENYLLNGGQESRIRYKMVQTVEPNPAMRTVYLSFVIPASYQSPTYNQNIVQFNLDYSPQPDDREEFTDERGNKVVKVSWQRPSSRSRVRCGSGHAWRRKPA